MAETAEDYRKLELAALQEAAGAKDPETRKGLMQYANLWRKMAEDAEAAEAARTHKI